MNESRIKRESVEREGEEREDLGQLGTDIRGVEKVGKQ